MTAKRVIFLSRAYNDIDCRMPLLLEFARDPRYRVEVMGIPSNVGFQDPRKHELTSFLRGHNVAVTDLFEAMSGNLPVAFIMRVYRGLERRPGRLSSRLRRPVFRMAVALLLLDGARMTLVLDGFRSSIVLLDEIAYQRGRSFFIDRLMDSADRLQCTLYSFLTGQDTMLNLWHDRKVEVSFPVDSRTGVPHFVPSDNDRRLMQRHLPHERIETVGNTRFDLGWVRALSGFSAERVRTDPTLAGPAKRKIVFMLSKIEYGVDLAHIVEAMNACAAIEGARVIVKPHTRGMSISELGTRIDARIIDGTRVSSSDLIEWSDTVLFTGSSIVFQAMQLGKRVIFLKNCQRYASIFDDSPALLIARSSADVERLALAETAPVPMEAVESFLSDHVYNGAAAGTVCRSVRQKIESLEAQEHRHAS